MRMVPIGLTSFQDWMLTVKPLQKHFSMDSDGFADPDDMELT